MNITEQLEESIRYYSKLIDICNDESAKLPSGLLSVAEKENQKYYSILDKGERHYIGKRTGEVDGIISRHFFDACSNDLVGIISNCNKALKELHEFDPHIIADKLGKAYSDVPDKCFTKIGFLPPQKNPVEPSKLDYNRSELKHLSATGIPMRSKSEVIIADIYTSHFKSYLYEEPLYLPNGEVMYPDFTLLSKDGKYHVYHEHCGMMTDPEYRKRFFVKLNKYIQFDYLPFRDVIFTFDESDGSIDIPAITKIISDFFD